LKQVDFNGKSTYSNIIVIESKCQFLKNEAIVASIFPNPAIGNEISVEVIASANQDQQVFVANALERVFYNTTWSLNEETNKITIDVSTFPTGTYFLKIGNETKTFVKINNI